MIYKLFVAAALSLGLGTAVAVAQTDSAQPGASAVPDTTASPQLPAGWDGAIGDAFFADPAQGTLRSEEEVRANWGMLSDEQQAQVRAHCATIDTAAADAPEPTDDTSAANAPTTGDTSSAGAQTDDEMTTGSTTPDTMHTASVEQVCDWIESQ